MAYKCTTCGKEGLDDLRAARGHIKFSGGEHGDRQELPSDWEASIEEVEGNGSEESSDGSDDGSDDEGSGSGESSSTRSDGGSDDGTSSDDRSLVSKILDTDLRELI